MAHHTATITWSRGSALFTDNRYSRAHRWSFDGGLDIPASSSPHVVPVPMSDENAIDPEEAFVASLSSCHMLWFLSLAARRGIVIDSYRDHAIGVLEADASGRLSISRVTLRPEVRLANEQSLAPTLTDEMHHEAHDKCFIARSVRCEVVCEPV